MRRPSASLALALALSAAGLSAGVTGCSGCGKGSGEPSDAGADGAQTPNVHALTPESAAKVLAKIGDDTITLGDFAVALEHMDQFDRMRYQSPERRKELLEEMIDVELLAREATEKGYDKDPLAQQELRAVLRDALYAEAKKDALTPAQIPESEVRATFDAHRADYKDPERRRLSVVVLATEAAAKAALAEAQAKPGNEGFGSVVRARSVDAQARADGAPVDLAGDLGIVSPPGDTRGENPRVPEEVRAAVYEIAKAGDVLPRTVAAGGKHYVVRLTQVLPAHERTFEEAERVIRVKLAQDKLRAKELELLADAKKAVKVEIDEAALAAVRVKLAAPPASGAPAAPGADGGR